MGRLPKQATWGVCHVMSMGPAAAGRSWLGGIFGAGGVTAWPGGAWDRRRRDGGAAPPGVAKPCRGLRRSTKRSWSDDALDKARKRQSKLLLRDISYVEQQYHITPDPTPGQRHSEFERPLQLPVRCHSAQSARASTDSSNCPPEGPVPSPRAPTGPLTPSDGMDQCPKRHWWTPGARPEVIPETDPAGGRRKRVRRL